jgi:hypothetical protein
MLRQRCSIPALPSDKKEAKSTVASVLRRGGVLKYKSHSTAENHIGFIQIRTGALLERLRRWPQGCLNPCTSISDDADLIEYGLLNGLIYSEEWSWMVLAVCGS